MNRKDGEAGASPSGIKIKASRQNLGALFYEVGRLKLQIHTKVCGSPGGR